MDLVDIDVSGTTIRAVDIGDSEVAIDTVGWDTPAPEADFESIPRKLQTSISGRASELTFPANHANVYTVDDDSLVHQFDIETERRTDELPADSYYINLQSRPITMVRFEGAATLRRQDDQRLVLSFDHSTAVTLGFSVSISYPQHTITVRPTARGVATALSNLSTPFEARGVQNVTLARQGHPPRIEFGDETDVPDAVAEAVPETDIELLVPEGIEWLYPAAPLSYYLGATVTTSDRDRPTLRAPSVDLHHEFDPLPSFQIRAADLVRRTYQLDLLVRTRSNDIRLAQWDELPAGSLDIDRLVDAANAERLRTYLDLPETTLDAVLPEWNDRWYVEPSVENATLVPFILNDIGLILQPDVASRFGDTPGETGGDDSDGFDPFVGWFTDESPPHAYQGRNQSFENELEFVRNRDAEARRTVVVNDPERRSAGEATATSFRERPPDPLSVETHHDVPRDDLAELLSTPTDVLHFVGDCSDALGCPDGPLDIETMDDVGVRLLVLDGPDSTAVGEAAIDRGSVAAVVRQPDRAPTLSADVRRLFFDLVADGFCLNYARLAADRYADGRSDLGILGSGLARIAENAPGNYGHLHGIEPVGDGRFVVADYAYVKRIGHYWHPDFPDSQSTLKGEVVRNTTDAAGVKALVHHSGDPIVYDDTIYWPDQDDLFYPLA